MIRRYVLLEMIAAAVNLLRRIAAEVVREEGCETFERSRRDWEGPPPDILRRRGGVHRHCLRCEKSFERDVQVSLPLRSGWICSTCLEQMPYDELSELALED